MRDPFSNPFPATDPDRRDIWEMLVTRDIDAFLAADWSRVAGDFIETGFLAINGNKADNPDRWTLAFPNLAAYRDEWLRQAQDFARESFAEDPRTAIFTTTNLTEIEIAGDTALVRKKFDGHLAKSDGSFDRMNWQTLYICRREDGRWKIAGFIGYLPHMPQ